MKSPLVGVALALATCLACAPLVAANPPAAFATAGILAEGTVELQGRLAGIHFEGLRNGPNPQLELTGRQFRIETDHQQVNVSAVAYDGPYDTWISSEQPMSGTILGGPARSDYDVFIAPLDSAYRPRTTVQAGDLEIRPGVKEASAQSAFINHPPSRTMATADVAGSQQLVGETGGRRVVINGSFVAVFWEWDLNVESPEGSYTFPSGEVRNETVTPPGGLRGIGSVHSRQTYVFVTDGELSLSIQDARWIEFHVFCDEVAVQGRLVLRGALPLGVAGTGQDREFHGDVRVAVEPLDAARLKATPEPASVAAAHGAQGTARGLAGALVALACVGLAAVAKRAVDARRYARLLRFLKDQDYGYAVAASAPLLRVRRLRSHVAAIRALALLKLDDPKGAAAFLDALKPSRRPAPSMFEYLQGAAQAMLGANAEAVRHLAACLDLQPGYRQDILDNDWFRPLLHHPALAKRLGTADPHPSTFI